MFRLAVAAVLLVFTACSHDAAPAAQSSAPPPAAGSAIAGPPAPGGNAGAHDITKPCSMISAEEVSAIVGFPVTSVDNQFECRYPDAKNGYVTVSLLQAQLKIAKDICDYAPDKRTHVPGIGDSTSYLGETVCVKLGDVAIIVDGSNIAMDSPAIHHGGAENPFVLIGKTIAGRIP